jgi:hypothetical protein
VSEKKSDMRRGERRGGKLESASLCPNNIKRKDHKIGLLSVCLYIYT